MVREVKKSGTRLHEQRRGRERQGTFPRACGIAQRLNRSASRSSSRRVRTFSYTFDTFHPTHDSGVLAAC